MEHNYEKHSDNPYVRYEEETTRKKREKIIIILIGYIILVSALYYCAYQVSSGSPKKETIWFSIGLICGLPSLCLLTYMLQLIRTVRRGETSWSEIFKSNGSRHYVNTDANWNDWMGIEYNPKSWL